MNAYKLADILHQSDFLAMDFAEDAATMLRQQADRIAELEKVSSKPVAWMMKSREPSLHSPDYIIFDTPTRDMKISHHPYSLYTHPVKQLSDEEIDTIYHKTLNRFDFARAIIKEITE